MSIDYKGAQELNAERTATKTAVSANTTAISGKQAVLTGVSGYDATKTKTLKNDKGTLKWVDDEAAAD